MGWSFLSDFRLTVKFTVRLCVIDGEKVTFEHDPFWLRRYRPENGTQTVRWPISDRVAMLSSQ